MSTFNTTTSKISEYSALLIWVNQNLKVLSL
jgi:hypothetical protein